MKTPHAFLFRLSLIAAAIFCKDTAANFNFVKDAHADNGAAWYKCYLDKMDEVHTDKSGYALS